MEQTYGSFFFDARQTGETSILAGCDTAVQDFRTNKSDLV